MSNEITDNVLIAEFRNMNIKQNTTLMYNIANQCVIMIANNYIRYIDRWFH